MFAVHRDASCPSPMDDDIVYRHNPTVHNIWQGKLDSVKIVCIYPGYVPFFFIIWVCILVWLLEIVPRLWNKVDGVQINVKKLTLKVWKQTYQDTWHKKAGGFFWNSQSSVKILKGNETKKTRKTCNESELTTKSRRQWDPWHNGNNHSLR